MGKNNVMANRNSFCARFINYAAVLILAFLSSYVFAAGGSFSGGGASGQWDQPHDSYSCNNNPHITGSTPKATTMACFSHEVDTGILSGAHQPFFIQCLLNSPYYKCEMTFLNEANYSVRRYYDIKINNNAQCPIGYEKDANGKCQPKKCPIGQTLVNGQCKPKQCPAGQALDANGNCMPRDDQCPAGQKMVNGRCITPPPDDPDDPDDPGDPNSEFPPFCEWASVMCQWHQEWQQWSNDYAANEQKANLDREELKRLGLDSKEQLTEINSKQEAIKQAIQDQSLTLEQVKQQDKQFYDELRLWLNNFDDEQGTPSEQYPPVEFPAFCDWSVQVCNWYLDWKDWRTDYNAHNALVIEKYNQYLQRLDEIKAQDKQFYDDFESYASAVTLNQEKDLQQNKDFYDEIRDFFDWYKDQSEQNPNDPNDPSNPENQDGDVSVAQQEIPFNDSQRITFVNGCPPGEQFTVSFMGSTQNLEFSYQPLCQFMTMIRPFVIAIAYLIGAYILMGLSRGSSE